ncbi:MAG: stage II sporulation protein R [Lachnospiraceae bacterium]|jgi:stage II sporulation protein R
MKKRKYSYKIYALAAALSIGLTGAITAGAARQGEIQAEQVSAQAIQQGIAREVLRFHVLANSDSEQDQQLKLQVKTAVVSYLEEILGEDATLADTRACAAAHLEEIGHVAEAVMQEAGQTYPVKVCLTQSYFPEKTYGDCTLPAGEYEALQVKIGEAQGKNWWCVLYPSLCFLDETCAVVTQEKMEDLRHVLTVEEYETITKDAKVKIRFKWLKR